MVAQLSLVAVGCRVQGLERLEVASVGVRLYASSRSLEFALVVRLESP